VQRRTSNPRLYETFRKVTRTTNDPLFVSDDKTTNHHALNGPEKTMDDETDLLIDLERAMTKLTLQPTKTVTFDLPESTPDTPSHDADDSENERNEEVENPISQTTKSMHAWRTRHG